MNTMNVFAQNHKNNATMYAHKHKYDIVSETRLRTSLVVSRKRPKVNAIKIYVPIAKISDVVVLAIEKLLVDVTMTDLHAPIVKNAIYPEKTKHHQMEERWSISSFKILNVHPNTTSWFSYDILHSDGSYTLLTCVLVKPYSKSISYSTGKISPNCPTSGLIR